MKRIERPARLFIQLFRCSPDVSLADLACRLSHFAESDVRTKLRDRLRKILVQRVGALLTNLAILITVASVQTGLLHLRYPSIYPTYPLPSKRQSVFRSKSLIC